MIAGVAVVGVKHRLEASLPGALRGHGEALAVQVGHRAWAFEAFQHDEPAERSGARPRIDGEHVRTTLARVVARCPEVTDIAIEREIHDRRIAASDGRDALKRAARV